MKKIFAALTAAILGLGLSLTFAPASWSVNPPLATDATANPSPNSGSFWNDANNWETQAGEVCVKTDFADPKPATFTVPAAPAGTTYSKLIIKSGSAPQSVTYENYVWEGAEVIVGAVYQHQEKNTISHVILCTVPVPDIEIEITEVPSAIPPTCEADGSLVLPVIAHVTWTGGSDGDGPGSYTITAVADQGYTISGQSVFQVEVLAQLTGEECDNDVVLVIEAFPSADPPTCEEDGSLVLPVIAHITWTGGSDGDGPGSYTITAVADQGYTISGQSVFQVEVLDQLTGEECEEKVEICHHDQGKPEWKVIEISINALPAHLAHQWGADIYPVPAEGCPTNEELKLVTPEISVSPPTCTTSGSYTVGGDGVLWTANGVSVIPGTHAVSSASVITFVATPGPGNKFPDGQQTQWVFTFGAPLDCFETLAVTGTEGVPLFLGGAAALLILGAAAVFFTRRNES